MNLAGIFYMCEACRPNTIPNEEVGNYKKKKRSVSINDKSIVANQNHLNMQSNDGSQIIQFGGSKQENKIDLQLSEIDHVDDQNVINNADHEDFNDQQWQNSLHIDDKPENEKPGEEI